MGVTIFNAILFMINSGVAAWNGYLYAESGNPISIAATIFCGLVSIYMGVSLAIHVSQQD